MTDLVGPALPTLPPLPGLGRLGETRLAWHALAEHVLAPARYTAEGRIGLAVTAGGFGLPVGSAHPSVRVDGSVLVVDGPGAPTRTEITTLRAAGALLGIEPGAPIGVYTPTTPLTPDAPLVVDPDAAAALAAWFSLGWQTITALGHGATEAESASSPTLWPEHFDAAIELGDEAHGTRGTFGVSPGDAAHDEPYLYVTHWGAVPDDAFWNDTVFPGASCAYGALASSPDASAAMRAFFEQGRATLAPSTSPPRG